jgi:hypothetical protein
MSKKNFGTIIFLLPELQNKISEQMQIFEQQKQTNQLLESIIDCCFSKNKQANIIKELEQQFEQNKGSGSFCFLNNQYLSNKIFCLFQSKALNVFNNKNCQQFPQNKPTSKNCNDHNCNQKLQ